MMQVGRVGGSFIAGGAMRTCGLAFEIAQSLSYTLGDHLLNIRVVQRFVREVGCSDEVRLTVSFWRETGRERSTLRLNRTK